MSKRTNGKTSDSPTPAPRRRKAPATETPAAPRVARSRAKKATSAELAHGGNGSSLDAPTYDAIATRAYFIALERGFQSDPIADWLQAEQQLREHVRR